MLQKTRHLRHELLKSVHSRVHPRKRTDSMGQDLSQKHSHVRGEARVEDVLLTAIGAFVDLPAG